MMIFEKICDPDNLRVAWGKVSYSKTPAGIDRMTCEAFEKDLSYNLSVLQKQLMDETYNPLPVTVFNEKKLKSKGFRAIGISTVRDRVVQKAILRVLSPYFENNYFLPCSYAYRPGRSALSAITKAGELIKAGNLWVLQMDVEQFFDKMDHKILLGLIERVINEKRLIRLISKLLKSKIVKQMGIFDTTIGSQQGSGISPLLSNIYLHPVDAFLWERYKDGYLRFSDDLTLFAKEKSILEEAQTIITKCLGEMILSVNAQKMTLQHVSQGIVYLGYFLDTQGKGPDQKSVSQLENRLKAFDKVRKTDDIGVKLEEIIPIIRGWYNYYKTLKPVNPPNVLSLLALAELSKNLNETSACRDLLKKSQDFKHAHPQIAFRLGELYSSFGMQKQAMREYARAIELEPSMEAARERVRSLQEGETDIHQAIEKIQLVLHHNPDYREGYQKLASYYSELGLYGFAQKAHEKALEIDNGVSESPPPSEHAFQHPEPVDFDYKNIDPDLFLSIFRGSKDVHAKQWVDERGKWGFVRVERPLIKKDIVKHLKGELTLAAYPVLADDSLRFIVFDVDTAKRTILESDGIAIDDFRKQTHKDILRIKTICDEMKLKLYIEDSGYKGRHGWLFFTEPVPSTKAIKLGQTIMKNAGGPSPGMIWELFPMGKSDRHNSMIKLPLGINQKNNRRCLFLSEDNEPIRDQGLFLKTIKKNDVKTISLFQVKTDADQSDSTGYAKESDMSELSPGLRKMITRCKIIDRLISKAKDINYLNHFERLCLLYTLTFAEKEGPEFLHKVIAYCINYDKHITQKQIDRRKASPMSCARIWEYFPEMVEIVKCDCKFDLPRGGYPSPVIYLLESEIETAKSGSNPFPENVETKHQTPEPNTPEPETQEPETRLLDFNRIFSFEEKKESESKESKESDNTNNSDDTDDTESDPEEIEEQEVLAQWIYPAEEPAHTDDEFPDETDDELHETQEDKIDNDAPPFEPDEPNEDSHDTLDVWKLAMEFMQLQFDREKIRIEMEKIRKRLEKRFEEAGEDDILTPAGTVSKTGNASGDTVFALKTITLSRLKD